jgi:hypothetical protein
MVKDAPHEYSIEFCSDRDMDFVMHESNLNNVFRLTFDDRYRFAHLPIMCAAHPLSIERGNNGAYVGGQRQPVYSIIAPINLKDLMQSTAFCDMLHDLKTSSIADAIFWPALCKRVEKLHTTVAVLSSGSAPSLQPDAVAAVRQALPLVMRLQGLFHGRMNTGRVYLKAYPERRASKNIFEFIQATFGVPRRSVSTTGLINLKEEIEGERLEALKSILTKWRDVPFVDIHVDTLLIARSTDDLFDETIVDQISAC